MLVVVENGDIHAFAQLAFDDETVRRFDVFQVDGPESGFQAGNDIDQFFRVAFIDLDIKDIDSSELLEQHGLAFHYRFRGQGAD